MSTIPSKTKVLVIGGGPAGSTASTLLARQGYDVTLLEKATFPRYHIGESLLPSFLQILDLLGAREKFEAYGFQKKHGAFLEWGQECWPLNFGELAGNHTYSFQVVRSDFDQFMLRHAESQGVKVFEGVEVYELSFDANSRPRCASWSRNSGGNGSVERGEIEFEFLIDASGRNSLMTNRYLKNRRYHKIFQNVAIWGYWENADRMATGREGDIAVNSIPEGWLWAIPLHDGKMSVGVVMHKDAVNARKPVVLEEIYSEAIASAPLIKRILAPAKMISSIFSEADYSYASERFCGPGFFLTGDSAAFLDPLLSSGVHLATFSASLAAASLSSIFNGEIDEQEAMAFFEKSYRLAYLRFLVFLSAFYDVNRGRESYFWEAQRLTEEDVTSQDLQIAFLKLVTGLKDHADSQSNTHRLILETMTKRIDENLKFRRDKYALENLDGEEKDRAEANARFFNSVEGMFSLNADEAIDGIYVSTEPRLHLARVNGG